MDLIFVLFRALLKLWPTSQVQLKPIKSQSVRRSSDSQWSVPVVWLPFVGLLALGSEHHEKYESTDDVSGNSAKTGQDLVWWKKRFSRPSIRHINSD